MENGGPRCHACVWKVLAEAWRASVSCSFGPLGEEDQVEDWVSQNKQVEVVVLVLLATASRVIAAACGSPG